MFKKIVVIIFFALLIRLPAYSLEKVGMESLLKYDNYELIYSDQSEDGIMTFILKKDPDVFGAEMMLCKIDNSKLKPINMGCFPFPLDED